MRRITPVHELKRRVAEQGRIRMGIKVTGNDGKIRPQKLSRLRFTSADVPALTVIAAKYGGTVEPWPEGPNPGLHQVTITDAKIPIVLPPDPLAGTPIYEEWSGGGCLRRCDGVDCTLALAADARPDAEPAVIECPCRAENKMKCKPRTRLNVVLREVPFGGTWRLESTGWNAAEELPGMVEMVMRVQEIGMVTGELGIEQRMRMVNGKMKRFVVPALSLPESIQALADGQMRMVALGKVREIATDTLHSPLVALNAGDDTDWVDEGVVDAELVDETAGEGENVPAQTDTSPSPARKTQSPRVKALHAGLRDVMKIPDVTGTVNDVRHGLVLLVTEGRSPSSGDMTEVEAQRALGLVDDLLRGERRYIGLADDGKLRVSAKRDPQQ